MGNATLGIYVLTKDSTCNLLCFDIDISKNDLTQINFSDKTVKYNCLKDCFLTLVRVIKQTLMIDDEQLLFEDTGGRGYHIWVFFEEQISGLDAIMLNHLIKNKVVEYDYEFFPKQPDLNEGRKYGNLIKLPLGIHRKYESESNFFKVIDDSLQIANNFKKNMEILRSTKRIPIENVENVKKEYVDMIRISEPLQPEKLFKQARIMYNNDLESLCEKCSAISDLIKKAEAGIGFGRSEAFHFTNILLSVEGSREFIIDIMKKSYNAKFLLNKTNNEIVKIADFYPTSCKTLVKKGICPSYCNDIVKSKNEDPLLTVTTPLSVYLTPCKYSRPDMDDEQLIESICNISNLRNAYWKLKK